MNNFQASRSGCKIATYVFLLTEIRFWENPKTLRSNKVRKPTLPITKIK